VSEIDPTAYNRLFHRLRVQALIQDLRRRFGSDEAFDIIAHAIRLESGTSSKYHHADHLNQHRSPDRSHDR